MWDTKFIDDNNVEFNLKYIIETLIPGKYESEKMFYSYDYFLVYKSDAGKVVMNVETPIATDTPNSIKSVSVCYGYTVFIPDDGVTNLVNQQFLKEKIITCKIDNIKVYDSEYNLLNDNPLTYDQIIELLNDCIQLNISNSYCEPDVNNEVLRKHYVPEMACDDGSVLDILSSEMYNNKKSFNEFEICIPTAEEWKLLTTSTKAQVIANIEKCFKEDWIYNELFTRKNYRDACNIFRYKYLGIPVDILRQLDFELIEYIVKKIIKINSRAFLTDINQSITRNSFLLNVIDYYIDNVELTDENCKYILNHLLQDKHTTLRPTLKIKLLQRLEEDEKYRNKFIKAGKRGTRFLLDVFYLNLECLIPVFKKYNYNQLVLFLDKNMSEDVKAIIKSIIEEKKTNTVKSAEAVALEDNITYLMSKQDIISAYSLVISCINASSDTQFESIKETICNFLKEFIVVDNNNLRLINDSNVGVGYAIINKEREEWFNLEFFKLMFSHPQYIRLINRYLSGYRDTATIERNADLLQECDGEIQRNYIGWSINNYDSNGPAPIYDKLDIIKIYLNKIQPDNMMDILKYLMKLELIILKI